MREEPVAGLKRLGRRIARRDCARLQSDDDGAIAGGVELAARRSRAL